MDSIVRKVMAYMVIFVDTVRSFPIILKRLCILTML